MREVSAILESTTKWASKFSMTNFLLYRHRCFTNNFFIYFCIFLAVFFFFYYIHTHSGEGGLIWIIIRTFSIFSDILLKKSKFCFCFLSQKCILYNSMGWRKMWKLYTKTSTWMYNSDVKASISNRMVRKQICSHYIIIYRRN